MFPFAIGTSQKTVRASVRISSFLAQCFFMLALSLQGGCSDKESIEKLAAEVGGGSSTGYRLLAADRSGNVHVVDEATGGTTPLPTLTYSDASADPVSSMIWNHTTGRLFAGHGGGGTGVCTGCIYEIDLANATATFLADNKAVNPSYNAAAGMAVRSDGTIFVEYESSEQLATLNSTTGVASPVGGFFDFPYAGCCGYGMVFSGGTLYMGNEIGLHTVDQANAQATLVGNWAYPNIASFQAIDALFPRDDKIASMAKNPVSGVVYGVLNDSSSGTNFRYLVTINVANAEVTLVGQINNQMDGLAFAP